MVIKDALGLTAEEQIVFDAELKAERERAIEDGVLLDALQLTDEDLQQIQARLWVFGDRVRICILIQAAVGC